LLKILFIFILNLIWLCCIFIKIKILLKLGPQTDPFDPRDGNRPIYLVIKMRDGLTQSAANGNLCRQTLRRTDQSTYTPSCQLLSVWISNELNSPYFLNATNSCFSNELTMIFYHQTTCTDEWSWLTGCLVFLYKLRPFLFIFTLRTLKLLWVASKRHGSNGF